jgi:hypothetical protein
MIERAMTRPKEFLYVNVRKGRSRGFLGEPSVPATVEIVVPDSRTGFVGKVSLPAHEAENVLAGLRIVIEKVREFQRDQENTIQEGKDDESD